MFLWNFRMKDNNEFKITSLLFKIKILGNAHTDLTDKADDFIHRSVKYLSFNLLYF